MNAAAPHAKRTCNALLRYSGFELAPAVRRRIVFRMVRDILASAASQNC
jgi:hypothetical protein